MVLDELILKLVQLLSAKDDKRKFRVYPVRDDLFASDRIEFEAEVYNDLYERVVNQPIELRVTDQAGQTRKFSFVTGPGSSRFSIGTLPQGIYQYETSTQLAGQRARSRGEFKVDKLALEALNVTADHNLLRTLAERSGGTFLPVGELSTLADYFQAQRPRDIVRSSEERREIIELRWLFFVLLALVSVEWFVRKYTGGY